MTKQGTRTVRAVERVVIILNSFTREKPERRVNELSRELGIHVSTVSRLMAALEQGGLLSRAPDSEHYRLGVHLIGLARRVITYRDVREVSRPFLKQLSKTCQETATLSVMEHGSVINLERSVPLSRRITDIGRIGLETHPHATAAGKVLLAHLAENELEPILARKLPRFTPETITDPQKLRKELVKVREQGYAVAQEELEEGLNVVAAPIYDHEGQVTSTVCIAGPAYRVKPELFPELASLTINVANGISEQLGCLGK